MKTIKGDLLKLAHDGQFNVIVHGCNCFNTMGGGIAKTIRETYPQAYVADCETISGDKNKLGTATVSKANNVHGEEFLIVNAYTQYNMSTGEDVFEYDAFQRLLNSWVDSPMAEANIGFPMIGMGLAGGDSKRILTMLRRFSKDIKKHGGSVTMVEFG